MRVETGDGLRSSCLIKHSNGRDRPMSSPIWRCEGIMAKLPSKLPSIILALETLHQ